MTSLKDALTKVHVTKASVDKFWSSPLNPLGLELVFPGWKVASRSPSFAGPSFVQKGLPLTKPKVQPRRLFDFGPSHVCVHLRHEEVINMKENEDGTFTNLGSTFVPHRCVRNVQRGRQNGFLCLEHQRPLEPRKFIAPDSIYRFNTFDTAQLELVDYIVGVDARAIAQAKAELRVKFNRIGRTELMVTIED